MWYDNNIQLSQSSLSSFCVQISWYPLWPKHYLLKSWFWKCHSHFKSDNAITAQSSIQSIVNSCQNYWCSFILHNQLCSYNHRYNPTNNCFLCLSQFLLHVSQNHPYNFHCYSFPLSHYSFLHPCFNIQLSLQFPPKIPSLYLDHSANSGCIKGLVSKWVLSGLTLF